MGTKMGTGAVVETRMGTGDGDRGQRWEQEQGQEQRTGMGTGTRTWIGTGSGSSHPQTQRCHHCDGGGTSSDITLASSVLERGEGGWDSRGTPGMAGTR